MLASEGPADLNVDRPRAEAAEAAALQPSVPCGYVDPQTVQNLAESLLQAVSHAAVLDTHAKPFASPADACPGLFDELRARLTSGELGTSPSLVALHAALAAWVESHRSWLTRAPLASESALKERADALHTSLVQAAGAGAAWVNETEALAPQAIARWDAKGVAHCLVSAPDVGELMAHKTQCAFRPAPCPNGGCFEVVAAAVRSAARPLAPRCAPIFRQVTVSLLIFLYRLYPRTTASASTSRCPACRAALCSCGGGTWPATARTRVQTALFRAPSPAWAAASR
jgi:hypothetical protein